MQLIHRQDLLERSNDLKIQFINSMSSTSLPTRHAMPCSCREYLDQGDKLAVIGYRLNLHFILIDYQLTPRLKPLTYTRETSLSDVRSTHTPTPRASSNADPATPRVRLSSYSFTLQYCSPSILVCNSWLGNKRMSASQHDITRYQRTNSDQSSSSNMSQSGVHLEQYDGQDRQNDQFAQSLALPDQFLQYSDKHGLINTELDQHDSKRQEKHHDSEKKKPGRKPILNEPVRLPDHTRN